MMTHLSFEEPAWIITSHAHQTSILVQNAALIEKALHSGWTIRRCYIYFLGFLTTLFVLEQNDTWKSGCFCSIHCQWRPQIGLKLLLWSLITLYYYFYWLPFNIPCIGRKSTLVPQMRPKPTATAKMFAASYQPCAGRSLITVYHYEISYYELVWAYGSTWQFPHMKMSWLLNIFAMK